MAYGNGGSYGEGTAAMPPRDVAPAQREPQVLQQLGRIDRQTETIHQAISELEARLSGVLAPDTPNAIGKEQSVPYVPLAGALASAADRLTGACGRLQSIIARIEV